MKTKPFKTMTPTVLFTSIKLSLFQWTDIVGAGAVCVSRAKKPLAHMHSNGHDANMKSHNRGTLGDLPRQWSRDAGTRNPPDMGENRSTEWPRSPPGAQKAGEGRRLEGIGAVSPEHG